VDGFVMFSCIAVGLIQMIALQYSGTLEFHRICGKYDLSDFFGGLNEGSQFCPVLVPRF